MKSLLSFLRNTITGGILFLLPVVLLVAIFKKAHELIIKIATPLALLLPDTVLGFNSIKIIAILLLVVICFVCGLLFRAKFVRKGIRKLEDSLLSKLPGYQMIKSVTADTLGADEGSSLKSILVQDGDSYSIGFLVQEANGYSTVFLPGAPNPDSGEVKIVPSDTVQKLDVPISKALLSLKNYGADAVYWLKEK